MIRRPVTGKGVPLQVKVDADWLQVACLVDVKLFLSEQLDDTSTPDSGRYQTLWPSGFAKWGGELSAVTVLKDDNESLWFTWQFFLELVRSNGAWIRIPVIDIDGFEKIFTGFVFVSYVDITGNAGEPWSKSSVQLQGSGNIDFSGTLTPITPKVKRIPWVSTAEQTIFQNNFLIGKELTEIMHVSSEGDDIYEPIDAGVPTNRQVKFDPVIGSLEFLNGRDLNAYVYVLVNV